MFGFVPEWNTFVGYFLGGKFQFDCSDSLGLDLATFNGNKTPED